MDYSNERYVRVYTRDTVTWKLLDWRARTLLLFLLRKVDRSGVLDVGDDGLAGVAAIVELPIEIVEAGMPQLIARGTIVAHGTSFTAPNFLEAQEAPQSDKLRAAEYRARRRDAALGMATPPATKRDARATKRDETITVRDETSRGVTRRHSSLAKPAKLPRPASQARPEEAAEASCAAAPPAPVGWRPRAGGQAEEEARRRVAAGEIADADVTACWEYLAQHGIGSDPVQKQDARALGAIKRQRPAHARTVELDDASRDYTEAP